MSVGATMRATGRDVLPPSYSERTGPLARHPGSVLAVAAMIAAFLAPPFVGYEAAWEIATALGYVAAAAGVVCVLVRPGAGAAMTAYRFTLHRTAGDGLLLLGLLHAGVMVVADPFLLDYLGWMMPLHVLAGILAVLLLALAVSGREPVWRWRPRWLGGARLHAWAGILGVAFVALHILMSSTRLTEPWRIVLVALALAVPPIIATVARLTGRRERRGRAWLERATAVRSLLVALATLLLICLGVPGLVALWRR